MTSFIKTLAIGVTFVAMAAAPSFAAPVQPTSSGITFQYPENGYLGTLTGAAKSDSSGYTFGTDGAFNDIFNFDITSNSKISFSYTAAYTTSAQRVQDLVVDLFSGYGAMGSSIASSTGTDYGDRVAGSLVASIGAGSYSFDLSGTSGDTPSVGGTLTVSVSTVPLPASAPMFGAALLALAGFGYGMNRWVAPKGKKVAASA